MKRISGISCLGIAMLLVILSLPAAPVSAGILSWSAETIPGTTNNVLGPAGIDIRDIAVAGDGTTVYAVPGDSILDKVAYRSTDAGTSWTALNINITADLIAVAPDDTSMVAIANSSTSQVYLTFNSGSNWYSLGKPQESGGGAAVAIYDITISKAFNAVNCIAVAGKQAGDIANVWYYNAGAVAPTWKGTNTLSGFSGANEAATVAFSPDFASDKAMVAITEKNSDSVILQIFSFNSNKWNDSAEFFGYPITIVSGAGITGLTSASLSLAPDYTADNMDHRTAFIGLTLTGDSTATANSGIYLLSNDQKAALKTGTKIHSVAFDGTNLIAGGYDTTTVYRSANPLATTPTLSPVASMKGPGGDNKVVVAWAGSKVVAGTSGKESAFAVSRNNGASFNDISLIDTAITHARDVAVAADGSKVYLVTDDGTDLSLWRHTSTWERILSRQGTADYIIRLAPEDANIIYAVKKGSAAIFYSKSGGELEWFARNCSLSVQDLAVAQADIAYALNNTGSVSKTVNAGLTWVTAMSTTLSSGASIVSVNADNLLVGSQDGYVAYSTDGNSSWTRINAVLASGSGKVQVTADEDFANNKIIYAASNTAGQNIKKWQIGASTAWTNIFSGISGGIYGLVMNGGTLYALEFNTSTRQSTLWYLLSPTAATDVSSSWSSSPTTTTTDADNPEVWLNASPQALKVSSDKAWAVKTNGISKLYSFTNILPKGSLLTPASGYIDHVNAITGLANDILFSWKRPQEALAYELQIALDENFASLVTTVTIATEVSPVSVLVGPHQTGAARVDFTPGSICYWRMRTTRPGYGGYSETKSFTIEPVLAMVPGLLTPVNGSSGVSRKPAFSWEPLSGAFEYQFVLSDNTDMISPLIDTRVSTGAYAMTEELEYGRTYFWQVRAVKPTESNWSTLANFTVAAKPAESVPPVIVMPVTPSVVTLPKPSPSIVIFTPLSPQPEPVVPEYLSAGLIIAVTLLLTVIVLIINPFTARPSHVPEGFSDRVRKPREVQATSFKIVIPLGTSKGVKAQAASRPTPEPVPIVSGFVVSISLANPIVNPGDTRTVSIIIDSKIELRGARCALIFDPALVKCDHVLEGSFFKDWAVANRCSTLVWPQPTIDNIKGRVSDIGISIKGTPKNGAKGSGVLCNYFFTAIASGVMKPTLSNVSGFDKTGKVFLPIIKIG